MARSPTDQFREQLQTLATGLTSLTEREATLRRDLAYAESQLERQRDELAALRRENDLLRQRLDDHLKRVETWDNRRWGLIVLMAGSLLSLASGLIVTLARK